MRPFVLALLAACATTPSKSNDDTDTPDDSDPAVDSPTDDTDTDGLVVDSGTGTDSATGPIETGDTDLPYDTGPYGQVVIEITGTADDVWELFIDGQPVTLDPSASDWRQMTTVRVVVPGQRHIVAVHAWDIQRVIAGFIATVYANEERWAVTGDDRWRWTGDLPDPTWVNRRFDDSAWSTGGACQPADAAVWGTGVAGVKALLDDGAQWMWARPCRSLGATWLRVRIGPEP